MGKQVLFIQGAGEGVHDRWDNRLVASLERELGDGYQVRYPPMPGEDDPSYSTWKAALIGEIELLDDGAILVGHSFGGTVLLHVLADLSRKPRVDGLFVVAAPFIGEGGWTIEDIAPCKDFSERLPPGCPVHLYHGADDAVVPIAHVHLYAKAIPLAIIRTLKGKDHQLNDDMSAVAQDIRLLP